MTASDQTYPVALERNILPLSLTRARLADVDLVVWRSAADFIHVWEDRCPHRSVRLSAGRNLGNCIEGVYHGWRFDEDGRVASVPAEGGKAQPSIRVRVLASEIRHGIVWASTGDKAIAPDEFGANLCRPIHAAAPAERLRVGFEQFPDLCLIATPWGSDECFIYGGSDDTSFDVRDINAELSEFIRRVEENQT